MAYFDATKSFDIALSEVELLLKKAKNSEKHLHDYLTYIKAAIVLLGAKFETYAEAIVENYADRLGKLQPRTKHLPRELRIASTTALLSQCTGVNGFTGKSHEVLNLQSAAAMWDENFQHSQLKISNKFSYGKHGSGEMRSLFSRIGIGDIFSECQLIDKIEDSMLIGTSTRISISPIIDSFTNIRNNIIHSDSTPNITHQQIHEYKEKFWEFSYIVDLKLNNTLEKLALQINSNP